MKGIVFSIEEFAINDGPGIRTTVFLKGCPLRCAWCHNPEGISPKPQWLEKKTGRILSGYEVDSDELAQKFLKNKEIFAMNSGGITLTGGEPLMQADFAADILEKSKPVHGAIETSGYAKPEVFKKVAHSCDLILFDIKHTNKEVHKKFTGVGNEKILKNLENLCGWNIPFIVRIPLIPEVNDTRENMLAIASLIKDAENLQGVEILPYHKTAGAKYYMLGKTYNPPFDANATPQIFADAFEEKNIKTVIL